MRPSYWHQIGTEPLLPVTVGKLLEDAANQWPDRVALVSRYQKHSFTYSQLRHRVNDFAAGLVRLGLVPGDRLAIWGHNSSQWHCAYLAATSIGIIVGKLDPVATPREVLTNLKKIEPRAIVCAEYYDTNNCVEAVTRMSSELGTPIVIAITDKHYPNTIRFQDVSSDITPELLNRVQELKELVQPDFGCDIVFTSGTTGHPKGALLSHQALLNNMFTLAGRGQFSKQEAGKWCVTTQFCHLSATGALILCVCVGMTLVIPGPVYNAEEVVSAIIEEKCTNGVGIPSQCVDFIQIVKQNNLRTPHLKYLMVGGAPVSVSLVHALKETFESVNVLTAFGMTETSGMTFMVSPDDDLEKVSTTVGRVADHIEVKVVDNEGRMVPMGTPGELWVRGYCNMLGYWGQPDKTREIKQEDGWLKTGDQFILTEDGYGKVVGRLKEMIIRENVNLFPLEIEHFLQSHPDILDVQAFGVPDPKVSEEMCVYIKTRDNVPLTEQNVRDFCKGQIADWKIPRYIMFLEDFPRSATGKVAKQQLKKMALEHLGLNKEENLLFVSGIN